jgi:tetratricopeptide (TPR) repeat protein
MAQMAFRTICGRSPPGTPTPGSVVSLEEEDTTSADALINTVISLIGVLVQLANLYAEQWEEEEEEDDDDNDANTREMGNYQCLSIMKSAILTSLLPFTVSHAVSMSETLYADAIHILSQAIIDVPDHRVELLAEWAEVLETMANVRADRVGTSDPALFDEALVKYEEAIEAATAVDSELLADLHFDYGQLCYTIADKHLVELNTLYGYTCTDPSATSILHTIICPYFDRACAAFRNAVQVSKGNAVMQERLGDACFVNATITADPTSRAHLMAEAEHWYRTAMAADAEDDEVIARLAQLCYRQQRIGECAALLAHWHVLGGSVQDLKREDRVFWPDFITQVPLLMNTTRQV